MPISPITNKLERFIKDRNDQGKYTTLPVLRRFADINKISRKDMGHGIFILTHTKRVRTNMYGYY